jgi:hypothetical protein
VAVPVELPEHRASVLEADTDNAAAGSVIETGILNVFRALSLTVTV